MPFAILVEMPVIVAHAGHWVIYALYAIPFLVVGFSIVTTVLRQRREDAGSHDSGQA
jgi:uncharacterized membrane protein HdeD (DUF308 family)